MAVYFDLQEVNRQLLVQIAVRSCNRKTRIEDFTLRQTMRVDVVKQRVTTGTVYL